MTRADAFIVAGLVAVFCAPGAAFGDDDPDLHWPRIAFEWETGQHVWVNDDDGQAAGWGAWYRVDDEVLGALSRGEQDDWIREARYPVLTDGPHCYIADVIVLPDAPRSTYRAVIDRIGELNADAASLSGNLNKRDGRERWAMRVNNGEANWWRRCQSDWRALH